MFFGFFRILPDLLRIRSESFVLFRFLFALFWTLLQSLAFTGIPLDSAGFSQILEEYFKFSSIFSNFPGFFRIFSNFLVILSDFFVLSQNFSKFSHFLSYSLEFTLILSEVSYSIVFFRINPSSLLFSQTPPSSLMFFRIRPDCPRSSQNAVGFSRIVSDSFRILSDCWSFSDSLGFLWILPDSRRSCPNILDSLVFVSSFPDFSGIFSNFLAILWDFLVFSRIVLDFFDFSRLFRIILIFFRFYRIL